MEKRIPGSMRTRRSLSELIEGRLSSPDGRSELVKLATRLIVEEALEAESRDALGRDYFEHGAEPGRMRSASGSGADYQDFAARDLGEYDIVYLFVDGIAERIRPGQRREPVMAAWGFTVTGAKVLLALMAGSKEDARR